jgi:ABC-type multidrug transport system fused ATPase/permease subunit
VQVKLSALNTILQENLAGIRVVKAFAREPEQQVRFERSADDLMGQQITVARLFTFLFPLVFLIANLGQAAVFYFGGQQIIQGTLTLGEWQEFSLYLVYVFFRWACWRDHHPDVAGGLGAACLRDPIRRAKARKPGRLRWARSRPGRLRR